MSSNSRFKVVDPSKTDWVEPDNSHGSDGGGDELNTRLSKLEEAVEGLKRVQGYTFNMLAIVIALLLGVAAIVLTRAGQLENRIAGVESKVDDLPGKINGNLIGITNALSMAITAARAPAPLPMPVTPKPIPPCLNGKKDCKPWERDWQSN